MKNIEDLNYLKTQLNKETNFTSKMKGLVSQLVDDAIIRESIPENAFVDFIEDITQVNLEINFSDILDQVDYSNANEHAIACLKICSQFKNLPKNTLLAAWLTNSLKFIDYIILNYIQDVKNDTINPDDYHNEKSKLGEERQRYDKLKTYGQPVSNAGSWLDKMYLLRNRVQHNTTIDKTTGKHKLKLPLYSQMNKTIMKCYPKTINLLIFMYK